MASAVQSILINEDGIKSLYFGYPDDFIVQGTPAEIEKIYKLDKDSILKEIEKLF